MLRGRRLGKRGCSRFRLLLNRCVTGGGFNGLSFRRIVKMRLRFGLGLDPEATLCGFSSFRGCGRSPAGAGAIFSIMSSDQIGNVIVERTGVGFFLGYAERRQQFDDLV
jgi:hypothetical protein